MKKLLFFLALATPALAQVKVDEIKVTQSAPEANGTNIRVNLQNGRTRVNLTSVELQARESEADPWQSVKVWSRKMHLLPGRTVALDYLPSNDSEFPEVLSRPQFKLRVLVRFGSKVVATQERNYVARYERLQMP